MDAFDELPRPVYADLSHDVRTRPLRVHDIIIVGSTRTQKHVIERKLRSARAATSLDELHAALDEAQIELRALGIFDTVEIVADAGPKELPDTTNIIVTVLEPTNALSTKIAAYRQVPPGFLARVKTVVAIRVSGHYCYEITVVRILGRNRWHWVAGCCAEVALDSVR